MMLAPWPPPRPPAPPALRWLWALALLPPLAGGCQCDPADGQQATAEPSGAAAASSTGSAGAPPRPDAAASAEAAAPEPDCTGPLSRWGEQQRWEGSRDEQNALLFEQLACVHGLDDAAMKQIRDIFGASKYIGQGNPAVAKHPVTVAQCQQALKERGEDYRVPDWEAHCGAKYMAPLYDPKSQQPPDATACIDRFEFPNIPCTYPVTWVRANEAVELCRAQGKRLCDAHEWEGACAGQLLAPDYPFDKLKNKNHKEAVKYMRGVHNHRIEETKRWAYGDEYRKGVCGTASKKSKKCGVGWRKCGTNTFPSGYFAQCHSALGVYDQHGNAAEHMNLPLIPEHLSTDPSGRYGVTEMKGSWFVFDQVYAHKDHCRWRAPFWHGTRVMNENSHRNYHLGFRCCKSVK